MHINNWDVFEKILNEKLMIDRDSLENTELDVTATAAIRGRISVLKELLRIPQQMEAQAWIDEPE